MNETKQSIVLAANKELSAQTSDPSAMRALIATVFKGFRDEKIVRQACLEAMMRGYSFQDIVNKKIYAIPFGGGYSLVQSINDVRAIAMRSGQVGKKAPEFLEDNEGKLVSCTVTVLRRVDGYVGEYTATVFFEEYNKGKDNWLNKPRTMISKVAEMHALRMAFPEELWQAYVEEEFDKESIPAEPKIEDRMKKAYEEIESLKIGNFEKKEENPFPVPNDTAVTETYVSAHVQTGGYGEGAYIHEEGCAVEKKEPCSCVPTVKQ